MTKKDYILISKAIKDAVDTCRRLGKVFEDGVALTEQMIAIQFIVNNLQYELQKENNRFDSDRFSKACGLDNK